MWESETWIHLIVIGISAGWNFVFYKMSDISELTEQLGASQERPCSMEMLKLLEGNSWMRTTMRIRTVLLQIFSGWPDTNSEAGVACLNINDTNSLNCYL